MLTRSSFTASCKNTRPAGLSNTKQVYECGVSSSSGSGSVLLRLRPVDSVQRRPGKQCVRRRLPTTSSGTERSTGLVYVTCKRILRNRLANLCSHPGLWLWLPAQHSIQTPVMRSQSPSGGENGPSGRLQKPTRQNTRMQVAPIYRIARATRSASSITWTSVEARKLSWEAWPFPHCWFISSVFWEASPFPHLWLSMVAWMLLKAPPHTRLGHMVERPSLDRCVFWFAQVGKSWPNFFRCSGCAMCSGISRRPVHLNGFSLTWRFHASSHSLWPGSAFERPT